MESDNWIFISSVFLGNALTVASELFFPLSFMSFSFRRTQFEHWELLRGKLSQRSGGSLKVLVYIQQTISDSSGESVQEISCAYNRLWIAQGCGVWEGSLPELVRESLVQALQSGSWSPVWSREICSAHSICSFMMVSFKQVAGSFSCKFWTS